MRSDSGTEIGEQINRELIKWCEAFLDEGHATWPMPGREQGFYAAWKFLAQQEWSPCGIKNSRKKLARLPEQPEDALLESLAVARDRAEARRDYLSLHLAALSGWAGFIKWRAIRTNTNGSSPIPIDLVQYLAVRLWYERELVQSACRKRLAPTATSSAIGARVAAASITCRRRMRPKQRRVAGPLSSPLAVIGTRSSAWIRPFLRKPSPATCCAIGMDGSIFLKSITALLAKGIEAQYQEQLLDKLLLKLDKVTDGGCRSSQSEPIQRRHRIAS